MAAKVIYYYDISNRLSTKSRLDGLIVSPKLILFAYGLIYFFQKSGEFGKSLSNKAKFVSFIFFFLLIGVAGALSTTETVSLNETS
jgi:hypothetical protein